MCSSDLREQETGDKREAGENGHELVPQSAPAPPPRPSPGLLRLTLLLVVLGTLHLQRLIKKDAHLNYARLSYEVGNAYESTPTVIQAYIDTYPNDHTQELKELLLDSYITSGNFPSALNMLEKSTSPDPKIYQQVALLYALQLYGDGNFKEALPYFQKAKNSKAQSQVQARATYWSEIGRAHV